MKHYVVYAKYNDNKQHDILGIFSSKETMDKYMSDYGKLYTYAKRLKMCNLYGWSDIIVKELNILENAENINIINVKNEDGAYIDTIEMLYNPLVVCDYIYKHKNFDFRCMSYNTSDIDPVARCRIVKTIKNTMLSVQVLDPYPQNRRNDDKYKECSEIIGPEQMELDFEG